MKILFIGGTGIISTACTALAAERSFDLTLLTRGRHAASIPGRVKNLAADISDSSLPTKLTHEKFDAVVDWIPYLLSCLCADSSIVREPAGNGFVSASLS